MLEDDCRYLMVSKIPMVCTSLKAHTDINGLLEGYLINGMRGNPHVRFSKGEIHLIGSYPNLSFTRPVVKKSTFLRLRGSFKY